MRRHQEKWFVIDGEGRLCVHTENDGHYAIRKGLQRNDEPVDLDAYIPNPIVRELISEALRKGAKAEKQLKEREDLCI